MGRNGWRVAAVGRAPVDVVWERYSRPDRWAGWAPQIRGVEHEGDRIRPGSRGVVRGPLGLRVPFTVDDVDERTRTWAWTVAVGPLRIPMAHGAHPCSAGFPGVGAGRRAAAAGAALRTGRPARAQAAGAAVIAPGG